MFMCLPLYICLCPYLSSSCLLTLSVSNPRSSRLHLSAWIVMSFFLSLILKVWYQNRDQKLWEPPYTNFEQNLSFFQTFHRHVGFPILNFESLILISVPENSCISILSKIYASFKLLTVILNFECLIGRSWSATSIPSYTNFERNLSFFRIFHWYIARHFEFWKSAFFVCFQFLFI